MKKYNKGIAIFIALMLLFLLSLAAIAVLLTAYNYNNICEGQTRRLKAMSSAESGINYVYWKLRTDPTSVITSPGPTTTNLSINGSNDVAVTITGPDSNGRYTIQSKGTYLKTQVP
ncbi:MAG: hypothetical protein Q8N76_00125 [Candidatus Omnitrophota bacterium]|nr:hypothetical protein [Candidatus Omnitrophota bacterium]